MKSIKETVSSFAIRQALNYARKDPDKNLMNLLNLFEKADIKKVNRVTYENLHKVLDDPNNNWTRFIKRILFDVDSGVLDKFVPVFMNIALNSYSLRTQAIEKIPLQYPMGNPDRSHSRLQPALQGLLGRGIWKRIHTRL